MRYSLVCFCLLFCCCANLNAATSPQDLLKGYMRTKLLQTPDSITGEGMCWHAAWNLGTFVTHYREHDDVAYLAAACSYFDALIAKMHKSPDGYRGFVGPYIYDPKVICDVHVGDSILINHMLAVAEIILQNKTKKDHQPLVNQANAYVSLAKHDLIEKWDKRGTWYEDGDHGGYRSWNKYMTADDLSAWRDIETKKSNLSLPFNKQFDMGIACVYLYRIENDSFYQDRALKIFNFLKRRVQLFDDHYVWNYWEPLHPDDVENKHAYKHWVNVHPYRNYQAGEIKNIVEAFHSGITFDKLDIQRFINTNLKVMYPGAGQKQWHNSNAAVYKAATGKEPTRKIGHGFKSLAGAAWTSLAPFNQQLNQFAATTYKGPFVIKRKYPNLNANTYERTFTSSPYFICTAVLPAHIKASQSTQICCTYYNAGDLKVSLMDHEGTQTIKEIFTVKDTNADAADPIIHNVEWSTDQTKPGKYLIRYSINNTHRDYPIVIK